MNNFFWPIITTSNIFSTFHHCHPLKGDFEFPILILNIFNVLFLLYIAIHGFV